MAFFSSKECFLGSWKSSKVSFNQIFQIIVFPSILTIMYSIRRTNWPKTKLTKGPEIILWEVFINTHLYLHRRTYGKEKCALFAIYDTFCILHIRSNVQQAFDIVIIQNSTQNSGKHGVTKICRLSWLTNSALVYEPNCVRKGGGGCRVSANEYSCAHRAQRNFGDL